MPPVVSMLHEKDPVPHGYGVREENIHQGSGLRIASVTALLNRSMTAAAGGFHPNTGILTPSGGQVTDANLGLWQNITALATTGWYGRLPVPMTPVIRTLTIPLTSTNRIQFRVTGFDQFGNHTVETTPALDLTDLAAAVITDGFWWVCCSKVFSYVTKVEFRGEGLNTIGGLFFQCGWSPMVDPAGVEAAAAFDYYTLAAGNHTINTLGTFRNWGIGTPLRVSPYGNDPYASTFATGTLTSSGTRANGETVTIDGLVYTFKTTLGTSAREVVLGGSETANLQNLYDAINRSGTPGTQYTSITDPHPTVRASAASATTVVVTARIAGSNGNTITTTETGTNLAWGAAALSGGADTGQSRFPEILGASGVLLANGTATPNTVGVFKTFGTPGVLTGVALGQSAPPATAAAGVGLTYSYGAWQGTPHKIGIRSTDAFATSPFELNGSSVRVGNTPASAAQTEEDTWMFSFTIRSGLGTQRDAVSGGGYPR